MPQELPSSPLPVLYCFRRCPYAVRARLALSVAAKAVEHREVELQRKPAEMLRGSPKGTVPGLALNNGTVLEQSLDTMRWALERKDPQRWLPDGHKWQKNATDPPEKQAFTPEIVLKNVAMARRTTGYAPMLARSKVPPEAQVSV